MMSKSKPATAQTTQLDRLFAAPMFVITIVFLVAVAITLHMDETDFWILHGQRVLWVLALLYPLYPLEAFAHWSEGSRGLKQNWLFCLVPFARLGSRDHVDQKHIWLPLLGWQPVSRSLAHRLMRYFSIPMIVIALLVLPVIAFELFFDEFLLKHRGLKLVVEATSAFIWASFVTEFVIILSVVEQRWRYCRQNWINIAVIVLPMIAFLRVVQLGRLLAIKQLVRTTRVFRLRGLLFRAWRAIVTLEVIDMILRREPAIRLARTKVLLAEKLDEIDVLRQEIARLEQVVAAEAVEDRFAEAEPAIPASTSPSNPGTHVEPASAAASGGQGGSSPL